LSVRENEQLVRRFFDAMNSVQGDIAKWKAFDWNSLVTPDYVIHFTNRDMNLKQFIEYNAVLFTSLPDAHFTVEDMVASEDKVFARYTLRGTFKNAYHGIVPTGKVITVKGASIERIEKGRDAETWDFPDMLSVGIQLGVVPDISSRM
jgi:predicted ester cyclase